MARKRAQSLARNFYGAYTKEGVKQAWEALRRNPKYRDAVTGLLQRFNAECPSLATRVRVGDFPSPTEYRKILATLPEATWRDLHSRTEGFAEAWKVRPLNPALAFEDLSDGSGHGIPPTLHGLHRHLWPDMVECPALDEAAQAVRSVVDPGDFAIFASGDARKESLRRAGWTPSQHVTLTVDLQFPLPDLMDRLQNIVSSLQEARHELKSVAIPTAGVKSHWTRQARQWRVWDHVSAGGSIADIARQVRIRPESARRDFYLAARAIRDVAASIREARRGIRDTPRATDFSEVHQHFTDHADCPAERAWETTDGLTRCPILAALLGFERPHSDWTTAGKGRARLAEEGTLRWSGRTLKTR